MRWRRCVRRARTLCSWWPGTRTWRGWAALLAEGLRDPRLHNLATSGAQAGDVEREQLPRALELRPDVASVIVGINDTLRSSFDPPRIARAAEHTVGALCSAGAVVLTIRLPDPGLMLGLPSALSRPLARRIHAVNAVMDDLAERFGTVHFDAAGIRTPMTGGCGAWTGCTRANAATA
jgi:lysophospholipase L1-like esterase